jgi:hypothetical protein
MLVGLNCTKDDELDEVYLFTTGNKCLIYTKPKKLVTAPPRVIMVAEKNNCVVTYRSCRLTRCKLLK